ncbi:MAG TPA: hypothetical protein VN317_04325 [Candidatus Methanoperedens sp.]|nr:hypothetical protein [Candidatus Methanoperedens sp.]
MLGRIKSFFVKEKGLSKEQVATLSRLPPDEGLAQLGIVLHDICVKKAAGFVEEQHHLAESPFRDLPKTDLFHEMLVLNFWVLEWLFKGQRPELMEHVFRHYNASFVWGWESSHKELLDSMRVKFKTYDRAWDDYSGHQDVFARQAIGIIFGDQNVAGAPQAAFWLITYADETMKEFAKVQESVERLFGGSTAGG